MWPAWVPDRRLGSLLQMLAASSPWAWGEGLFARAEELVCSCLRGVAIEWAISADTPAPYPLATRLAVSCSSHKNHQALPQQSPRTSQLHDLRATKCLRDENNPLLLKMEKLPLRQIGFKSPQVSTLPVISLSPPPVPQSDKRGGGRIMSS